jgi:hypothetical protein
VKVIRRYAVLNRALLLGIFVLVGALAVVRAADAMTIDARAALDAAPTRVEGRVLATLSNPSTRTTEVVLGDDFGHEVARFTVLGARVGGVQWVADGAPAFVVGERVNVGLTPLANGFTVALSPDGEPAVRRLAPSSSGASGELYGHAAGAALGVPSTVTMLVPSLGGAVPDDPELVTVRGAGFGAAQGDSRVTFQGIFERVDADVVLWSDDVIVCRVPAPGLQGTPQVLSGPIKVWTPDGGWSDGDEFIGGSPFSVLYQWAGDSWPIGRLPVEIWVNPADSPYGDQLAEIATQAASQWNVRGAYARLVYRGLTVAEGGNHNDEATPRDGRNTVIWRSTWQYTPQILALTWSSIDTLTYEREEVEMEINGTRPWTIDPLAEPNKFDLISTMTHEFGHWLRLGHTQSVPSVMSAFISTGVQRREISAGDGYGASWIHPSYGVEVVPVTIASGATLTVPLTALDRQGVPLAGLAHDLIEVKAIRLSELEFPEALDPPVEHAPAADVHADLDADVAGGTSATFAGLPDGRYRIETTIEGHLVRPAAIVRVGEVPVPIVPALVLAGVTPSPLVPGVRGRVSFSLPEAANVMLDLYDARGRRVREIASGPFPAGSTDLSFDTLGRDGRSLGAGVYYLRLSTLSGAPFEPRTSRVVILP